MRDWLRTHGWVAPGWDVVFIAKDSAAKAPGLAIREDLARVVRLLPSS